jgi:hypothetical protein
MLFVIRWWLGIIIIVFCGKYIIAYFVKSLYIWTHFKLYNFVLELVYLGLESLIVLGVLDVGSFELIVVSKYLLMMHFHLLFSFLILNFYLNSFHFLILTKLFLSGYFLFKFINLVNLVKIIMHLFWFPLWLRSNID